MKYIKYSLIAALCFLMTQCTEEGDKTYPQQPAPQWSVVAEDFVSEVPAWQVADNAPASAPGWRADFIAVVPCCDSLTPRGGEPTSLAMPRCRRGPILTRASIR